MDVYSYLLGEISSEEAGRYTGELLVVVGLVAGIWKCWSISRRTTTNSKCVLGLMFVLLGWFMSVITVLVTRWLGPSPFMGVVMGMFGLALMAMIVAAIVLAIIGLLEFSRQPGVFTQGRSQAIWALVLGGIMGIIFGTSAVRGFTRASRFSTAGKTRPAKTVVFDELNFRFETPGNDWVSYDATKVNKDSKLSLLRRFPEVYFLIIAERLGGQKKLTSQGLAELGKAHLQAATTTCRVMSEEPFRLNGLDGVAVRTDASAMGYDLHYLHWYIETNGYAYQLTGFGKQTDRDKVDAEVKKMFAHFFLLDTSRIARAGGAFQTNFVSSHYNYQVRLTNSLWGPWASLAQSIPEAEFGASRGDTCFMIVPVSLSGEKVEPAALAAGLLAVMGIQFPDEKFTNRKALNDQGAEGLQYDFQRELSGNSFNYRLKVLQRQGDGYLFAAWTQRKIDKESVLEDALARLDFLPVPISLQSIPRAYPAREKQLQGFVLNHAGLFHFKSGEYEKALPLFCAAARANEAEPIYVVNAFQCWSHLDRPSDALAFLKTRPESTLDAQDVRAWQAYFQKESNLAQEAITNYSILFNQGYRSDAQFAEFVNLLTQSHRDDEALTLVEKYLSKGDSVSVRVLQAEIYSLKKNFQKALSLLKEQHEIAPFNLQVSRALAETSLQAGLYNEALQIASEMTQANGDRALGFYLKGRSELGLRWYREAKTSFEAASKLAPANREIASLLEHVSAMLGEGSNSDIKNPIDPVEIPPSLTNSVSQPIAEDYAKDYGAYYSRRIVAVSWKPKKEFRRTEFLLGQVRDVSGVTAFSTVQIPFNPLSEQIYVNELRVMDRAGATLASGKPSDYYVLDDQLLNMASHKKILNIPVPGLEPGCQIAITITTLEPGREEFPFLEHTFSLHLPVRESSLFLSGETAGLKHRCSTSSEPEKLGGGLYWRLAEPAVARWEPLQAPSASYLPMLWVTDAAARWPMLVTNYLSEIADRLELDTRLLDQAKKFSADSQNEEAKVVALTRHVQTNLTYKAIEFGRRARIPNKPPEIARNKYGDCKDHAVLLQQMLNAAGVPAHLALVSHQGLVQQDLPSLDQFDHMIVYLPGKSARFIDCTDKGADAAHQIPIGLANRPALILDAGNPRFISIPSYSEDASRIGVERHVSVTNSADLAIDEILTLAGVHAAYMRDYLLQIPTTSRRAFFQRQMGLSDAELIDFEAQALETPETPLRVHCVYRIKQQFHNTGTRLSGVLRAGLERAYLAAEPVDKRLTPFELTVPTSVKSRVTIDVPKGYRPEPFAKSDSKLDSRFASAQSQCRVLNEQLNIEFECRQQPGKFPAADYSPYRDAMGQVMALLEREVSFTAAEN